MRDETIIKTIEGVKVECRVRVPYISSGHIDFEAEDSKVTWISETGYRSYFFCLEDKEVENLTSEELVEIAIKNLMKEKGITEQPNQFKISAY